MAGRIAGEYALLDHDISRARGHRTGVVTRRADAGKGRLAPAAVPASAVHRRVARPREHQHRGRADERRPRLQQDGVRVRRRRVLRELRAVRAAEQPDPRARRRAHLDRANHDHLGRALDRDVVRERADELLRAALPARSRGGRLPPRDHLLPRQLVSLDVARARGLVVHARDPARAGDRRAARGFDPRARRLARAPRLAMVVLDRRPAGRVARRRRAVLSDGRAGARPLARARGARVARGRLFAASRLRPSAAMG